DETPTVSTLAAGDAVNTVIQVYDNRNVGNTHVLNVSVVTIKDGANVDVTANYDINLVASPATGVITSRPITVTAVTNTKVYDGNTSAVAIPTFPSLQNGDVVSTQPIEVYNNPLAGTGKTMTASGLVINDGNGGNNYIINYVQNSTGVITTLAVTSSVNVSPTSKQYSDLVTYTARIVGGAPLVTGGPQAAQSATFKVGTQEIGTATFTVSGSDLVAILTNQPLVEPTPYGTSPTGQMSPGLKTVTAVINNPDLNFSIGNLQPTTSLSITKEDARVNYTGLMFQATPNTSTSTATVLLQASVIDISAAIGDPAYDAYAGDIRNARVKFVNRDANTDLTGWLTPSLINAADPKVGTVSAPVSFNIGSSDAQQFTVGIVVDNGYYLRDDQEDNTVVTVYKPLGDFVVGGGFIKPTQSSGTYASTSGFKTNFGLNVKYNKRGTNLQGSVNIIFRRNVAGVIRTYQIKTNSMTSLGVGGTTVNRKAQFLSKANLRDITDPLYPVSLGGNLDLRVDMADLGEPGNKDSIGVTLYEGGTLLYSSNWIVSKTVPMVLTGGNIQINGANFGPAIRIEGPNPTDPRVVLAPQEFAVKVLGNPSLSTFRLQLQSNNMQEKFTVKVVDINGRLIEVQQNLYAGQVIELGSKYTQGTYFAEVMQGTNRNVVKLVKISRD
ncbi:YDG domain-containing protein, partial [Lacibacter sp. H375]|uniref:YDG domain-containing protein n=1 Tax=Lacibacter sp. H375 TaxID=3133424 RepID=UPI0030BDF849